MKALVTGHVGFLGHHFKTQLEDGGWKVDGCDVRDPDGSFPFPDARDMFDWRTASQDVYDLVVHCAAFVGGRVSIEDGGLSQAVNLELDAAMFRWAVRTQQRRVLYISSSAVYPVNLQKEPGRLLAEADMCLECPMMPDELYGWAKLTGEILAARARAEGVPVTVVRPFSGYGEDQDVTYPFRAFAERARRREDPFTIWGSGEQARDWVHVDDVVGAALALADAGVKGPVNIGNGLGVSMKQLALMFCAAAGYAPQFAIRGDMPAGVNWRVADTTLLAEYYTPKVILEEGVHRALA